MIQFATPRPVRRALSSAGRVIANAAVQVATTAATVLAVDRITRGED